MWHFSCFKCLRVVISINSDDIMDKSQSKPSGYFKNGKALCTTIPQDLVKSVKVLAREKEIQINQLMIEAIQDLLSKYEHYNHSQS